VLSDVSCSESEYQIQPCDDVNETSAAELEMYEDVDMSRWLQVDSDISLRRQHKTRGSSIVDKPARHMISAEQQLSKEKAELERKIECCRAELQKITHGVSKNSKKDKVLQSATLTNSDTDKCEVKRSGDRRILLATDKRSLSEQTEDVRHPTVESKDHPRSRYYRTGDGVNDETRKFRRSHTPPNDKINSTKAYRHSGRGERRLCEVDRSRIGKDSPDERQFSSKLDKMKAPSAVRKSNISDKKFIDRCGRSDKCSDLTDENSDDSSQYRRSYQRKNVSLSST